MLGMGQISVDSGLHVVERAFRVNQFFIRAWEHIATLHTSKTKL